MEGLPRYLEEKRIKELFRELMEQICLERPNNVHAYIVAYIQDKYSEQLAEQMVKYEDEEEEMEEQDDVVPEIEEKPKMDQNLARRRRSAVSAESVNPDSLKNVPKQVIPKTADEQKRIYELLKDNFLFSSLDNDAMNDLINAMAQKIFHDGDVIMKQGDDGDYFYIIEEGETHIFVKIGEEDKLVKECKPGDSFGELALMYNAPRAATVKTVTPELRTWAVDRQTFKLTLMESTINKRDRYEKFLESVPILDTLYKWEKLTIADALQPVQYAAGEVVCTQGEMGDKFYIIERGTVEYLQRTDTGEDMVVGESKGGDYFGEIALLTNSGRAATVRCTSDCSFLTVDRKTFVRVMGPLDVILRRNVTKYKSWMEKKKEQP